LDLSILQPIDADVSIAEPEPAGGIAGNGYDGLQIGNFGQERGDAFLLPQNGNAYAGS